MGCELGLINQQPISLGDTSSFLSQNPKQLILKNESPQRLSQMKTFKLQKGFDFLKGQFNDLPGFQIIDPHSSISDFKKHDRVVKFQEGIGFRQTNLNFISQLKSSDVGQNLCEKAIMSKRSNKQLKSLFQNSSQLRFQTEEPQEKNSHSKLSCQNLELYSTKEAQKEDIQRSKKRISYHSKKERRFQIQSSNFLQFFFPNKELFNVRTYRYKIPEVYKNISEIFRQIQKDQTFKMPKTAVIKPSQCMIHVDNYIQMKNMCRKKIEKRRVIQVG